MGFIQTALTYIVPFLLVLTLVVTVHEFGHFLAARLLGVKVDRFSIGFGKAICSRTDRSGVEWRLAWLPLGGYVRFAGDESAASVPDQEDLKHLRAAVEAKEGRAALQSYFHFKPVWQRAIVVAAGPFANFILAIALFAVVSMWFGDVVGTVRVSSVQPNTPAAAAGFRPGDVVVEADGRRLKNFGDLQQHVGLRPGVPVSLTVQRDENELVLTVTPVARRVKDDLGAMTNIGTIGLVHDMRGSGYQRVKLGPVEAVGAGAAKTWDVLSTTVGYLSRVVTGRASADQLGGPLRIGHTAGGVTKMTTEGATTVQQWLQGAALGLITLSAVLSVGIGFMNLLPVPVLDGGHLVFYAYEAIARRPVGAKVQEAGYRLGLALLLGLMLFATWNDFQNLRVFQLIGGLVS